MVAGSVRPVVPREELVLYVLLVIIGAMPVIGVVADHVPFGAEATIGLVLAILGALGLLTVAARLARHAR
jgi:hypothetical protein